MSSKCSLCGWSGTQALRDLNIDDRRARASAAVWRAGLPWNLPRGGRLATHEVKVICRDHKNVENEDQCIILPLHELTLEAAAQAVGVPVWHLTLVGAALVDNPGQATPGTLYTLEQFRMTSTAQSRR